MTRRPVLPGAAELFRRTDTPAEEAVAQEARVTELPSTAAVASSPALRARRDEPGGTASGMPLTLVPGGARPADDGLAAFRAPSSSPATPTVQQPVQPTAPLRRGRPPRQRAERIRHDEKITVYISADELVALETARLTLRAQHGLAADRGRIVREAIGVLLADLAERGEESVLVARLRK